jgi:hypothetical protein
MVFSVGLADNIIYIVHIFIPRLTRDISKSEEPTYLQSCSIGPFIRKKMSQDLQETRA